MKHKEALRRRDKLIADLTIDGELLRGSLLKRMIHHTSGCAKCASGGGHPAWILTVGYPGGITKQFSIRRELKPRVEEWLENYQKLKARLEEICELNHILIRPDK